MRFRNGKIYGQEITEARFRLARFPLAWYLLVCYGKDDSIVEACYIDGYGPQDAILKAVKIGAYSRREPAVVVPAGQVLPPVEFRNRALTARDLQREDLIKFINLCLETDCT